MHASSSTSSSDAQPERKTAEAPVKAWKFPVAALAALILVGGFEAAVWKYRYWTWDAYHILAEKKRKVLTGELPADTMAVFGVSRFYHLPPNDFENLLGQNAEVTNYSWRWCGMEAYEVMLRGLIQANRIPKFILVDGTPEIWGYKSEYLNAAENEILQVGLTEIAPRTALMRTIAELREWEWLWNVVSYTLTPPSTLHRDALNAAIRESISTRRLPSLPQNYQQVVQEWEVDGAFVFAAGKRGTLEEYQQLERLTGPYKLYKNKQALINYERFIRLASSHNIEVIMLPVPNNPLIYEAYEKEGVFSAYDKWLNVLENEYSNFHALRPRWLNWPDAMGDGGHVHEDGAIQHRTLLLEMLTKHLRRH